MLDRDTVVRHPHSDDDPRVSVTMRTRSVRLVLFFADVSGEGPMLELRVEPDDGELTPRALGRLVPTARYYEAYARAAVRMDLNDAVERARVIRTTLGVTRRGLGPDFYPLIAETFRELERQGDATPVTTLARMHDVHISTASKWLRAARDAGLLPQRKEES